MTAEADPIAVRLVRATAEADWPGVFEVLRSSFTHLAQSHPQTLLEALEALPEALLDREPRLRIARSHIGRQLHGEEYAPHGLGSALIPLELRPADRISVWTATSAAARAEGRLEEALRVVDAASAVLDGLPAFEEASLSPILPEILHEWALTAEQAGRYEDALARHVASHDWASALDHRRMTAASAGSVALISALAGRNVVARSWLARVPPAGAAVDVAAVLAEALLHVDRLEPARATELLESVEAPLDRLLALQSVRALAAWGRPLSSVRVAEAAGDAAARTRQAGGQGRTDLLRLVSALTGVAIEPRPAADPLSPIARVATAVEALAARLRPDEATARQLAGPLLDETDSPRVLVLALLAARADSPTALGDAARVAHAHECFGPFRILPPTTRGVIADHLDALGDHGVAGRLRALADHPVPALPAAQREIAVAAARGASTADIAALRGVSVNTVKTQLRAVYRRLGVRSRRELAAALDGDAPAER